MMYQVEPISFEDRNCTTLPELLKGVAEVKTLADFTQETPHTGNGGRVLKYEYTREGKTMYALERKQYYSMDSFHTEIWLFDADFTAQDASRIIREHDAT